MADTVYPVINVLTNAGAALIASSVGSGRPIVFVKGDLGTGSVLTTDPDDLKGRTAVDTHYADAVIAGRRSQDSALIVSVQFRNTSVLDTLYLREIGLLAKLGADPSDPGSTPQSDNDAILFSYLTFGSSPDIIPAVSATPVMRLYDIPFDFAAGGTTEITPSGMVSASSVSTDAISGAVVQRNSDGTITGDITGNAVTLGGHEASWYSPATHTHNAATASAAGFMSASDKVTLDTLSGHVDQGVKATDTPTFAGIKVNGYIDGAQFR